MPLKIQNPEANRLARELARRRGETMDKAVTAALREQSRREPRRPQTAGMAEELLEIGRRFSALPLLDDRSDDEILGCDAYGLPR